VRRSGGPAPGPRACGEPGQRFGRGEPERDRREMACQVADLVLPEGGRPDFQLGGVGSSYQAPFVQGRGGPGSARGRSEAGQVGKPAEAIQCGAGALPVGRSGTQVPGQRAARREAVPVPLAGGAGAGMEFRLRLRGPGDHQSRGKAQPAQAARREHMPDHEARDLSLGVDARVGASCAVHLHSLAEQLGERVLQGLLHGREPRLPLPAAERRPVVRKRQCVGPAVRCDLPEVAFQRRRRRDAVRRTATAARCAARPCACPSGRFAGRVASMAMFRRRVSGVTGGTSIDSDSGSTWTHRCGCRRLRCPRTLA